jgi:hypothetical protein
MNGVAHATKIVQRNKLPEVVWEYKRGNYFGELSIINDEPRAADIIAVVSIQPN